LPLYSCILHPCIFDRIAFSTPAFSVAPFWVLQIRTGTVLQLGTYEYTWCTECRSQCWNLHSGGSTGGLKSPLGPVYEYQYRGSPVRHFRQGDRTPVTPSANIAPLFAVLTGRLIGFYMVTDHFGLRCFGTVGCALPPEKNRPQNELIGLCLSASEMAYIVSGAALNSTHALTRVTVGWNVKPSTSLSAIEYMGSLYVTDRKLNVCRCFGVRPRDVPH